MSLTSSNLKNHIICLQIDMCELTKKLSNRLCFGKYAQDLVKTYDTNRSILKVLRQYKAFDSNPTYAYKFKFSRTDSDTINITITINGDSQTYSGKGSSDAIASHFKTKWDAGIYKASVGLDTLYIYSYDSSLNFSSTTSANITSQITGGTNSITVTSLENKTSEILDLWNMVSQETACNFIDHVRKTSTVI